ncbi:ADP-forming succinate--CoA ligase subunit beta [Hyperthermus butylicus]|uniref:Succinate--CoA ligase [ADP-forming] subunit beta n=1 Tax=Hyperthermus butylicus (strain DSM 5456 / JCM 9403 / PLM1-5) TaxID=415426 RepID=A2BJB4_HYPBU|nr:ADP-forming succinate--CoA ligase subunit beta [Hyperthermus butylicus]ABM80075.1 Succinyl-CoA synthetase beta chain [Hyperthermus butylicus DSM 5456]
MKLFEFEAKEILRKYGADVPPGVVIARGEDAREKILEAGLEPPLMVKSQVLVAGRGKAGGIRRANSIDEAVRLVGELFETPIKGLKPRYILVEKAVEHEAELYTAITLDRSKRRPVVLVSRYGGMDIEEIAREKPESIIRMHVDPVLGLRGYHARKLGKAIGLSGRALTSFAAFLQAMYQVFVDYDAELVESNPLGLVGDKVIPLDARIIVDDNALYRHQELAKDIEETGEYSEWEIKARRQGLAFVELDGDIGIIGNGAGLTMATMDLVYEHGGRPANFLDIGGGASAEAVKRAVLFLFEYPKARKIFINIFGGITRCDEVARGVVEAIKEAGGLRKPIVIRLTGTNEEEGRRILREHGIEAFDDPFEAVKRIISL